MHDLYLFPIEIYRSKGEQVLHSLINELYGYIYWLSMAEGIVWRSHASPQLQTERLPW